MNQNKEPSTSRWHHLASAPPLLCVENLHFSVSPFLPVKTPELDEPDGRAFHRSIGIPWPLLLRSSALKSPFLRFSVSPR
jgi:hypothetical protein